MCKVKIRPHQSPAFSVYEYRARVYNPNLGRFMSEDPKLFDAGDYNLFRYCHNDPIDNTDPMGTEQYHDEHNTSAKDAGGQQAEQHLSASEALWNRQMNMRSSFAAIAHGVL